MSLFRSSYIALISLASLFVLTSAGWTVTRYYEESVTTEATGFEDDFVTPRPDVKTETIFVTPTATHLSALQTETITEEYQSSLVYVDVELAPGQGAPIPEHRSAGPAENSANVNYYILVTYTWPASCSSTRNATVTESALIFPPSEVQSLLTPTSVDAHTNTYDWGLPETATYSTLFLDSSDVPSDVLSSAMATATPLHFDNCGRGRYEAPPGCKPYKFLAAGKVTGFGYCCPDGCHHVFGITPLGVGLAAGFSVFGLFFLLGIGQSACQFHALMTGQKASRGLPVFFACLIPILTCPLFCFSRHGFEARSIADQIRLSAEWRATPFWKKVLLWLKYGFRYKYPPMLGTPPPPAPGEWEAFIGKKPEHQRNSPETVPLTPATEEAQTRGLPMGEARTEPAAIPRPISPVLGVHTAVPPPPTYETSAAGPSLYEYEHGGGPSTTLPTYSASPRDGEEVIRK